MTEARVLSLVGPDDPILAEKIPEYAGDPAHLEGLAREMFQIMRSRRGVGIAAPQVGERVRMFVMAIHKEPFAECWVCINPVILSRETDVMTVEGCLTIPGRYFRVLRSRDIEVEYTNLKGERRRRHITGLAAVCFQHEHAHLDGITVWVGNQAA